jgi:predicted  nucleic acid-binding Zn-ribbon protein
MTEALFALQKENRHLKETIAAQREAMERVQADREEDIQRALAAAQDEILLLRGAVSALREEMEQMDHRHAEALQADLAPPPGTKTPS